MRSASRPVLDFAEVRCYDHRCIVSAPWSRQLAGCKRARSSFSASGRLRFCSSGEAPAQRTLQSKFSPEGTVSAKAAVQIPREHKAGMEDLACCD